MNVQSSGARPSPGASHRLASWAEECQNPGFDPLILQSLFTDEVQSAGQQSRWPRESMQLAKPFDQSWDVEAPASCLLKLDRV